MKRLFKNYKFLLFLVLVGLALFSLSFNGLQFGIDFKGGTIFQIHLAQKPTAEQLSTITTIIQQRIDSFGLRDSSVKSFGDDFVIAQIAETDTQKVEQIETIIKTQGKFESILDGEVVFSGSDIIQIVKDPAAGYGFAKDPLSGAIEWNLPFKISQESAVKFSKTIFHKCKISSFSVQAQNQYDCKVTYFFIDRPTNSVLVFPKEVFQNDSALLLAGSFEHDISAQTDIEELLQNSSIDYFLVDENGFSEEQKAKLVSLALSKEQATVHPKISGKEKNQLKEMGFKVKEFEPKEPGLPWVWAASGARQTISLTPGITGLDPFIADVESQKIYSELVITGTAADFQTAQKRLGDLTILLETGSLPIPIDDVSNETISPFLGKEFLDAAILMGAISLLMVSLIVFIRYRNIKVSIPIIVTGISEVLLVLGIASFFRINLDLASVAGILAVVGTGVDHQIVIMDELMRGEFSAEESLAARVKKAFFIIVAASATVVATMLPIIFFGLGLGKLIGFALTTIAGVFVGVLVTRPVFAEMAKIAVRK
ncbi:MAG: hypothetical protein HYW50_02820 [Candidatus Diapherotrites archaeon]|nr:hypothetical protein [Candidatus Diapherotrites archaeon]